MMSMNSWIYALSFTSPPSSLSLLVDLAIGSIWLLVDLERLHAQFAGDPGKLVERGRRERDTFADPPLPERPLDVPRYRYLFESFGWFGGPDVAHERVHALSELISSGEAGR